MKNEKENNLLDEDKEIDIKKALDNGMFKGFKPLDYLKLFGYLVKFLLIIFFCVYGLFNFAYDHIICDYTSNNNMVVNDNVISYNNFTIHNLNQNEIKYRYGSNISGIVNQQFFLYKDTQIMNNCHIAFKKT